MTDLTTESVAVRLYAAYWDGRQGTPEDIAMYLSCNPVGERWKSVAAEHERICSERIAAMEGWRPIEEAPKRNVHENTEEFLGYCPTRPKETRICIIFWMPSENRFGILGGSGVRDKLTHFRPIPAPPQHGDKNG
jgi:hypothetical protein